MTARQRLNRTKAIETVGKTISSDQMDVQSGGEKANFTSRPGEGTCSSHSEGSSKCHEGRSGDHLVPSQ